MADAVTPYVDGHIFDDQDANWAAGFGDGTDGAFSESSGTTNLTQGTPYQYTSFLLDTNATLSASSTSAYPIIIYVQGNCTINGTITLTGKGAIASYSGWGTIGEDGQDAGAGNTADGGVAGLKIMNFFFNQKSFIMNGTSGGKGGTQLDFPAGGGGASKTNNGGVGPNPAGGGGSAGGEAAAGVGGCTIYMVIGGTLTFGADSSIDVSGTNGANGGSGDASGAGGGGSGDILIFHRGTKTDNGLATDVTGGTGGSPSGGGATGATGGAGTEKIADWATILW